MVREQEITMDAPRYRAKHASFVVVQSPKYVLLVKKRGEQLWGFAGGRAQPLEEPIDTARRKLSEEIGIAVRGEELKAMTSRFNHAQLHWLYSYQVSDEAIKLIRGRYSHVVQMIKRNNLSEKMLQEHIAALILSAKEER